MEGESRMCASQGINATYKRDLEELIHAQRQSLSASIGKLSSIAESLLDTGEEAINNPIATLSKTVTSRITNKQKWEAVGVSALAGGAVGYLASRHATRNKSNPRAPSFASSIFEPIALVLAQEAQLQGYRAIKKLFQPTPSECAPEKTIG